MTQRLRNSLEIYLQPSALRLFFLGMSSGIPLLLIFSSQSLWLREAGLDRSTVTYFSWAALGYSFKFVWAPLVDRLPLPLLTARMGRRRAWLLVSQLAVILSLVAMGFVDPATEGTSLQWMALFAVALGFSAATQDICVDAFRIESETQKMQAALAATYTAGYRVGMILSGAGALYLASYLGSTAEQYSYSAWKWTYIIMAGTMGMGVITTFLSPEPAHTKKIESDFHAADYARFLGFFFLVILGFVGSFLFTSGVGEFFTSNIQPFVGKVFSGFLRDGFRFVFAIGLAVAFGFVLMKIKICNPKMVQETYVDPAKEFFQRYSLSLALLVLALIGMYRISDIVLGAISNVFYQDMGYTKEDIATASKTFGLVMTILGGFLGGILTFRYGVLRILFLGAVLSAATNLLFMWLAFVGGGLPFLYVVLSADNISAGIASTAFVAFLSALTNVSFTAIQYAIFTSFMFLVPKLIGGYSGTIVDAVGYQSFFAFTAVIGIPVLFLIRIAAKRLDIEEPQKPSI